MAGSLPRTRRSPMTLPTLFQVVPHLRRLDRSVEGGELPFQLCASSPKVIVIPYKAPERNWKEIRWEESDLAFHQLKPCWRNHERVLRSAVNSELILACATFVISFAPAHKPHLRSMSDGCAGARCGNYLRIANFLQMEIINQEKLCVVVFQFQCVIVKCTTRGAVAYALEHPVECWDRTVSLRLSYPRAEDFTNLTYTISWSSP